MSNRRADVDAAASTSSSSDDDDDVGDDDDVRLKDAAAACIDAEVRARATTFEERIAILDACVAAIATASSTTARPRDRRRARERLGRIYGAIVRGRASSDGHGVISLNDVVWFLSRAKALRAPSEASRVALDNGIAAHLRALYRDGALCTPGSIAEEEAHEVLHGDGLFAKFIGRRCDRAITRAARALRRRYATLDAATRGKDGDSDGNDGAMFRRVRSVAVEGWLGAASEDEYAECDFGTLSSPSEDDDEADFYDDGEKDERRIDAIGDASAINEDNTDDGSGGVSYYVPVEGAKFCDVEKDEEFIVKEIISLRRESDQSIAKRVQANLAAVRGAEDSADGRRAKLFADLFKKYARLDSDSDNVHTGAVVREMNSHNPKYNFFRGTEPRTRIEPTMKGIEFRSVAAHVKEKKALKDRRHRR